MKLFWPVALPWQPPELHPSLVKIGTTWLRKLTGISVSMFSTVTRAAADLPAKVTRISAVPLPCGLTTPSAVTVATLGSLLVYTAVRL